MKKHLLNRHEDGSRHSAFGGQEGAISSEVVEMDTKPSAQAVGGGLAEQLGRHEHVSVISPSYRHPIAKFDTAASFVLPEETDAISPLDAFLAKTTNPPVQLLTPKGLVPMPLHLGSDDTKDLAAQRPDDTKDFAAQRPAEPRRPVPNVSHARSVPQTETDKREVIGILDGSSPNEEETTSKPTGVSERDAPPLSGAKNHVSVHSTSVYGGQLRVISQCPSTEKVNTMTPQRAFISVDGVSSPPRKSPTITPKVSFVDRGKSDKVKPEPRAEARSSEPDANAELKSSSPSSKKENEEQQRAGHANAAPAEISGKDVKINKPRHTVAPAKSEKRGNAVLSPSGAKPVACSGIVSGGSSHLGSSQPSKVDTDPSSDKILVGIGERIKRRTKCNSSDADRGDSEEEGKETPHTKRRRAVQHASGSEDNDDGQDGEQKEGDEDDETDSNGVPKLEAKIGSIKGAWFDIELLAFDSQGDEFHVRTKNVDSGDKEWVAAGQIRRQCKAFEKENVPDAGSTVCVYTQMNKKNAEQLYYDGHISRICNATGKYEVTLLDGPDSGQKVKALLKDLYEINTETIPIDTLRSWCPRSYRKDKDLSQQAQPRKVCLAKGDFAMFEDPGAEKFRVAQLREEYTGEICEEWSEDEDAPTIRVRWLFTASQLRKRQKGVLKGILKGRETNPHELFVSENEEEIDGRTIQDQCEVRFCMTGQPPDASELKTWKSNHFYTVLAYDRAQQNLLPLNSELLSHKLKKIIKRCHSRSSTGSSDGRLDLDAAGVGIVKESSSLLKESRDSGKENVKDTSGCGIDGEKEGSKEGGGGNLFADAADAPVSNKKRERVSGGGVLSAVPRQEGEDVLQRPGKCGRASPMDGTSKTHKKHEKHEKTALACDAVRSPGTLSEGVCGDPKGPHDVGTGPKGSCSGNKDMLPTKSIDSSPCSALKAQIGTLVQSADSRKEGKSDKGERKRAATELQQSCSSDGRELNVGKESVREVGQDGTLEVKSGLSGQTSSKGKGVSKDMHAAHAKGSEGGVVSGARGEEGISGDGKASRPKSGAKRKSADGVGGKLPTSTPPTLARTNPELITGGKHEAGEDEDSGSGQDEAFRAGRGRDRKMLKTVQKKKVGIDDGNAVEQRGDAPLAPSASKVTVDNESTDGISGDGSPESAGGGRVVGVVVPDMTVGVSVVGRKEGSIASVAHPQSPSCHGFSMGERKRGGRERGRLSARHSKWKIVTFSDSGEDGPATRPGAGVTRVQAGQVICIAFDLIDSEGKAVQDDARLRACFDTISFRGHLSENGDATWTRGLEQRANLMKLGGLVCGEVRIVSRPGRYVLKAYIRQEDEELKELGGYECGIEVLAGPPSLHRSALTLHLVNEKGESLVSCARNGNHSARAATGPRLMGATSIVGHSVHAELSIEKFCDDNGNVLASSPCAVEELAALLRVTHVHPLQWGEAQNKVALQEDAAECRSFSGEGRLLVEADTESVDVTAKAGSSGASASATQRRVRLFTLSTLAAGNHVLLFRGLASGGDCEEERSLLFHIDLLVLK